MNSSPVISAAAASDSPCATVLATGFSPSTGSPANSAAVVTGWCATGTVTSMTACPPLRPATSTASVPTARSRPVADGRGPRRRGVQVDQADQFDLGALADRRQPRPAHPADPDQDDPQRLSVVGMIRKLMLTLSFWSSG